MPYRSRWSLELPHCSFPTLLFGTSPDTSLSNPDKVCFAEAARSETHFFSRASFRLWSQRLAVGLRRSPSFNVGDRVLLFSSNDLFFPVAFMGVIMAGGVFTGANPTYTSRELAHQLRNSDATYLLCSDVGVETGKEAAKLAGLPGDRVFIFNNEIFDGVYASRHEGIRYWGDLIATEEESRDYCWPTLQGEGECHTTLALNFSSGTTGVSKGVEITHMNYVANTLQFAHLSTLHPEYAESNARAKWLCYLPMYHALAQNIHIAGAFLRGTRFVESSLLEVAQVV